MSPIDWNAMSDEELAAEVQAGTEEKKSRDLIAKAPEELNRINREVLHAEGIQPEDAWRQPIGGHDAYVLGWTVTHNGSRWSSTIPSNVWEPGVTGWAPLDAEAPAPWIQPLGSHDSYSNGDVVTHKGQTWVSNYDYNVWEPGVSGWSIYVENPGGTPIWVQPTGSHDSYALGAEVIHKDLYWRSNIDNNTWEPGAFGWTEFTPA